MSQSEEEFQSKLAQSIQDTKSELTDQFSTEQAKVKKQNFWMTAITFKIKNMVQQKLVEEQQARLELQSKFDDQTSQLASIET